MKKFIISYSIAVFIVSFASAQINRPAVKKHTEPTKTEQTKSTATQNPAPTLVYSLTAVKVNIRTGNDNKEFPSALYIEVWQKDHPGGANYTAHCLFKIHALKNEMAVNSTVELGLEKLAGANDKFLLNTIQTYGLELSVGYSPNFFMDAWKIENVSWTLEFKDQFGNLHPTMGSKVLTFTNSRGTLNDEYGMMKCFTDQNLSPLLARIEKG